MATNQEPAAGELIEQIAGLGALAEQLEKAVRKEFREGLAARLKEMANGTEAGDREIRDCVQGVELPADWKPTQEYRDGIAFAAELAADPQFDI